MSLVNRNEMTIEKRFYLICLNINGQIDRVRGMCRKGGKRGNFQPP